MSSTFDLKAFGAKNAIDLTQPWSHWFFYGDSGSGKTEAASTFPNPIFIIPHNEQSIVTLRGRDFPYFEVVDMDRTPLNLKTGRGSMMHIIKHIQALYFKNPNNFPFDSIVCESMTHYGDLAQDQITNGNQKQMAQNDWGTLSSNIRQIQLELRKMQVHSVMTALAITEQSDDGKTVIGGPMLTGKLASKLPSSCDVTGYCEVIPGKDGPIHRIHFKQHRQFPARSRFRRIPTVVQDFSFEKIAEFLEPDTAKPTKH